MISELHDDLRDAGLPITGISRTGSDVNINWETPPTAQQEAEAQQIVQAFIWDNSNVDYAAEIAALTTEQRNRLLQAMMVAFVRSRPRILQRIKDGTLFLSQ